MSIAVNYFRYHFLQGMGKSIVLLIALSFISFAFTFGTYDSFFFGFLISIFLATVILPIMEFGDLFTKRNYDTWFSLPISKQSFIYARFFVGAVKLLIISFAATAIGIIKYEVYKNSIVDYIPPSLVGRGFVLYFVIAFFSLCLYSINSFVYLKANNTFDALVFLGAYNYLPCQIILMIKNLFIETDLSQLLTDAFKDYFIFYNGSPFISFHTILSDGAEEIRLRHTMESFLGGEWFSFIFYSVIGILCMIFIGKAFALKDASRIEDISDSIFGYKVLIPILAFTNVIGNSSFGLFLPFTRVESFFIISIILKTISNAFWSFVYLVIYKRGVKRFNKWDIINNLISIVLAVIISSIVYAIRTH